MWSCVQQDVNRLHFTMIARLRGNLVEVLCIFTGFIVMFAATEAVYVGRYCLAGQPGSHLTDQAVAQSRDNNINNTCRSADCSLTCSHVQYSHRQLLLLSHSTSRSVPSGDVCELLRHLKLV